MKCPPPPVFIPINAGASSHTYDTTGKLIVLPGNCHNNRPSHHPHSPARHACTTTSLGNEEPVPRNPMVPDVPMWRCTPHLHDFISESSLCNRKIQCVQATGSGTSQQTVAGALQHRCIWPRQLLTDILAVLAVGRTECPVITLIQCALIA